MSFVTTGCTEKQNALNVLKQNKYFFLVTATPGAGAEFNVYWDKDDFDLMKILDHLKEKLDKEFSR